MPNREEVEVARPSGSAMRATLVRPDGAERAPAVVVIHEIFGLNDHIRSIAERLAAEGYVALAVDLFSGGNRAMCLLRVMGGMLLRPLDNSGLDDLRRAVAWLEEQPGVDPARVGVIGFCMGGGYALALACVDRDVRAASVFYGMNPRPLTAVADACPIVGSYPEKDFTRKAAVKLEALLRERGRPHDIKIYPGARHGFFNDTRGVYDRGAAEDAWTRTLRFFGEHLAPAR
jgi:carboxymethylenebutenolidase